MDKAQLQTEAGQQVAELDLPPFVEPPQIILWGTRHFVLATTKPRIYRESFCWVAPEAEVKTVTATGSTTEINKHGKAVIRDADGNIIGMQG